MPIFSGMEVANKEGDAFQVQQCCAYCVHVHICCETCHAGMMQGVLAFVLDDGRVVVCGNDKSEEERAKSRRMIAEGKVLDANQFITKNVRRTVLLQAPTAPLAACAVAMSVEVS